jgi:hypothetical protein
MGIPVVADVGPTSTTAFVAVLLPGTDIAVPAVAVEDTKGD